VEGAETLGLKKDLPLSIRLPKGSGRSILFQASKGRVLGPGMGEKSPSLKDQRSGGASRYMTKRHGKGSC
jgi:hypothetical protein